eukprot:TRINITY_DN66910_c0_g1_i1.p1 TRINITY_DN66910_c0_g1~~TRINITY_DN66910_c0_g1_i1.p1  ORF type:complete len:274 (-),score=27.48 TRINITY_DN66910_c0_g1_i1:227-1048(-)
MAKRGRHADHRPIGNEDPDMESFDMDSRIPGLEPRPKKGDSSGMRVIVFGVVACFLLLTIFLSYNRGDEQAADGSNTAGSSGSVIEGITNPVATLETSMGVMKAEIFLNRVPITASNFIDLSKSGFYNGLHFHRVIPNFMDQFGCPLSKDPHSPSAGTGGPPNGEFENLATHQKEKRFNGGNIKDEHLSKDSNQPGTLSMANTGAPDSGGSQFFINVHDNSFLDWFSPGRSKHPVFGKLIEGYDVAVAISKVKTRRDNPIEPVMMKSITISGA